MEFVSDNYNLVVVLILRLYSTHRSLHEKNFTSCSVIDMLLSLWNTKNSRKEKRNRRR